MPPLLRTLGRRRLCAWLVGALLLVQWLVAAHACPSLGAPVHQLPTAVAAAQASPCHAQMDQAADAVCHAQCADEQKLPPQPSTLDHAAPAAGWCIVLAPASPAADAAERPLLAAAPPGAPPGWPPLYILNASLRN